MTACSLVAGDARERAIAETKRKSRSVTQTASVMLSMTSAAMRRSRSAARDAVTSRTVPDRRTGLPSSSRSTILPRTNTQTELAVGSAHAVFGFELVVQAVQVVAQALGDDATVVLVHVIVDPDVGRLGADVRRLCRSAASAPVMRISLRRRSQSQNSSPDPHSARRRRFSRSADRACCGRAPRARRCVYR